MKSCYLILMVSILVAHSLEGQAQDNETDRVNTKAGTVELWDNQLKKVLNPDAQPEIMGKGFEWSEGPVWVQEHQFLLFSDVPANTIYKWEEDEGITKYLKPSGFTGLVSQGGESGSNGLIIDQRGRLVLCQHGDRRIARMNAPLTKPSANFSTIASTYKGKKFNSPNDVVQHSSGAFYFTDPPYGLPGGSDSDARELDIQGVYRVDTTGNVTLLVDSLSRPNGLALSPEEQKLYVANSDPDKPVWMVYDVKADGSLADGRVFFDASEESEKERGLPDGMKVDAEGYIYATGPGGVWVFAPNGKALGRIKTGQATSNCAIGNQGSMLYMTADMYLMRIPLR